MVSDDKRIKLMNYAKIIHIYSNLNNTFIKVNFRHLGFDLV